MEWPGRCSQCKTAIVDWTEAGFYDGAWVHKSCWTEAHLRSGGDSSNLPLLQSPVERSRQLDWPMMFFLLLFHFGLGAAIAGWLMLTQTNDSDSTAVLLLVIGIVIPLIGVTGVALNVVSRRRIELIRQSLDLQGGWKPGR